MSLKTENQCEEREIGYWPEIGKGSGKREIENSRP